MRKSEFVLVVIKLYSLEGSEETRNFVLTVCLSGTESKYVERSSLCNDTTTTLEFIITVNDDDAGDQTGTGGPVDENVGGTLTATIAEFRPTNASAVTLASPTFTTTDGFQ